MEITIGSPIRNLLYPFRQFFASGAAAGILLMIATAAALLCANSPLQHWYHELWELHFSFTFENFSISKPLHIWINDGLMAMFFFVVGLEMKREILTGELSSWKQAALPAIAAFGGMAVPATIYALINYQSGTSEGWGVPMATDIAFVLGVLALLGNRVPASLKVFLTALAIVDDLGAVLVIALFYSTSIDFSSLTGGALFFLVKVGMNACGVRNPVPYGIVGIGGLWTAFLLSGIHPTIAGVLAAFTIPARSKIDTGVFYREAARVLEQFNVPVPRGKKTMLDNEQMSALAEFRSAADEVSSPLQRLERQMHGWVLFLVMPLFAFANAGVEVSPRFFHSLLSPISLGVMFGLIVGKQVGVTAFSWIAVRLGLAQLPADVSWRQLYYCSWLAGIGFTMSLFIAGLAFKQPDLLDQAKGAVLIGSLISGTAGYLLLRFHQEPRFDEVDSRIEVQ